MGGDAIEFIFNKVNFFGVCVAGDEVYGDHCLESSGGLWVYCFRSVKVCVVVCDGGVWIDKWCIRG